MQLACVTDCWSSIHNAYLFECTYDSILHLLMLVIFGEPFVMPPLLERCCSRVWRLFLPHKSSIIASCLTEQCHIIPSHATPLCFGCKVSGGVFTLTFSTFAGSHSNPTQTSSWFSLGSSPRLSYVPAGKSVVFGVVFLLNKKQQNMVWNQNYPM